MKFNQNATQHVDLGDDDAFTFSTGSSDVPFSVSLWMYPTSAVFGTLLSKYQSVPNVAEYGFYSRSNGFVYILDSGGLSDYLQGYLPYTLSDILNKWTHLVFTYDGSGSTNGVTLYRNAVSGAITDESFGSYTYMTNTATPLRIGARKGSGGITNTFLGSIADVRIWNRALSADEIFLLSRMDNGSVNTNGGTVRNNPYFGDEWVDNGTNKSSLVYASRLDAPVGATLGVGDVYDWSRNANTGNASGGVTTVASPLASYVESQRSGYTDLVGSWWPLSISGNIKSHWGPGRTEDSTDTVGSFDGTLNDGASIVADLGWYFTANTQYVKIASTPYTMDQSGSNITISLWAQNLVTNNQGYLFAFVNNAENDMQGRVRALPGKSQYEIYEGADIFIIATNDSATAYKANTNWNNYVCVMNQVGDERIYYINGVEFGRDNFTGVDLYAYYNIFIGNRMSKNAYWAGYIDEVTIFTEVVSSNNLLQYYNNAWDLEFRTR